MILKKGMICNLLLLSLASAAMGKQSSSSVLGNTCMSSTAKSSNERVSITCQGNISQPTTTCCINATAQKTNYKDSIQECPPSSTSTGPTPVCSVNCTIRLSSLQSITVSGEPKVSQKFKLFQQTGSKMTPSQVSRISHHNQAKFSNQEILVDFYACSFRPWQHLLVVSVGMEPQCQ